MSPGDARAARALPNAESTRNRAFNDANSYNARARAGALGVAVFPALAGAGRDVRAVGAAVLRTGGTGNGVLSESGRRSKST